MLGFRHLCEEHRQLFSESVKRNGELNPEEAEEVRLRLLAWLCERYPAMVLDHFNRKACLGCGLKSACVDLAPIHDCVREAVLAAAGRRPSSASSSDLPTG